MNSQAGIAEAENMGVWVLWGEGEEMQRVRGDEYVRVGVYILS